MTTKNPMHTLTQHQLELVALFASGYSYNDIAKTKFLSYNAVRQALERARVSVGADSLTHLCALSVAAGALLSDGAGFKPSVDPTVM